MGVLTWQEGLILPVLEIIVHTRLTREVAMVPPRYHVHLNKLSCVGSRRHLVSDENAAPMHDVVSSTDISSDLAW
jgi:hypothetical protein